MKQFAISLVFSVVILLLSTQPIHAQGKTRYLWQGNYENGTFDRYALYKLMNNEDIVLMRTAFSVDETARDQRCSVRLVPTTGLDGAPQSQIGIDTWVIDPDGHYLVDNYTWTRKGKLTDTTYQEGVMGMVDENNDRWFPTGLMVHAVLPEQQIKMWIGVSEDDIRANRFLYADTQGRVYMHPSLKYTIHLNVVGLIGLNLAELNGRTAASLTGNNIAVQQEGKDALRTYIVESIDQSSGYFVDEMKLTLRQVNSNTTVRIPLKDLLAKGVPVSLPSTGVGPKSSINNAGSPAKQTQATICPPGLRVKGVTFVPLRFIGEWLGAAIEYSPAQKITFTNGRDRLILTLGNLHAERNGRDYALQAPPFEQKGMTYVPLRFIAEGCRASVSWDPTTQRATIVHPISGSALKIDVR